MSLNAESRRDGGDDRRTDAVGHEGGHDHHERKERDKCLPCERHAAIHELDLEHAFPHTPEEQSFQPIPQYRHAATRFGD